MKLNFLNKLFNIEKINNLTSAVEKLNVFLLYQLNEADNNILYIKTNELKWKIQKYLNKENLLDNEYQKVFYSVKSSLNIKGFEMFEDKSKKLYILHKRG